MLEIRALTVNDAPLLQKLYEHNPRYFQTVSGHDPQPGTARENLTKFPPGFDESQAVRLGAFVNSVLYGVIIGLPRFPSTDTAHIALLLVDLNAGRKGIGSALHNAFVHAVLHSNRATITTLRLAIVETNLKFAEPFWLKMGYSPTRETKPYKEGSVESRALIYERPI